MCGVLLRMAVSITTPPCALTATPAASRTTVRGVGARPVAEGTPAMNWQKWAILAWFGLSIVTYPFLIGQERTWGSYVSQVVELSLLAWLVVVA